MRRIERGGGSPRWRLVLCRPAVSSRAWAVGQDDAPQRERSVPSQALVPLLGR